MILKPKKKKKKKKKDNINKLKLIVYAFEIKDISTCCYESMVRIHPLKLACKGMVLKNL